MKKVLIRIKKDLLKRKKYLPWVLLSIFLAVLLDIFVVVGQSDLRFYGVIFLYLFSAYIYKFSSKITFSFCLVVLLIIYIRYLFFGPDLKTEEASVWWVLFFTVGVLQKFKE